ncbi:MAG TPA: hypothetical protein VER04_16635 [Polyangiaceae bacterium]|nr:hypothetical protein [Polyangiaceae bacterium]
MKVQELKSRLKLEGFSSDLYSINNGPLPSYEGLILSRSNGQWKIEHFERGIRRELETFASEEQACDRMYELLMEHFSC